MDYLDILLVDDEANVRKALRRAFNNSGLAVQTAADAMDALDCFDHNQIAVVISDQIMPGMRGVELLSRIRGKSPDTTRILMTAHADLEVAVAAINQGEVFRFVVKPWNNEDLVNIVREARDRFTTVRSLRHFDDATILSLARTVELKDVYTRGHSDSVAGYAHMIAAKLGFSEMKKKNIKHGSWLHDIGKIGVPEAILNKPGALTEEERAVIKKHPGWGADVARQACLDPIVVNIINYHHEKFDGSGYPVGLAGEAIPLEARIVAVADVYDAITTDRVYRKRHNETRAVEILINGKGSHFDPGLVDIFLKTRS